MPRACSPVGTAGRRDAIRCSLPETRETILARFSFQLIEDGVVVADEQGLEFEQLELAELDSAIAMAEMMVNRVARPGPQTITVVIRDERREPVARVILTLTKERLS